MGAFKLKHAPGKTPSSSLGASTSEFQSQHKMAPEESQNGTAKRSIDPAAVPESSKKQKGALSPVDPFDSLDIQETDELSLFLPSDNDDAQSNMIDLTQSPKASRVSPGLNGSVIPDTQSPVISANPASEYPEISATPIPTTEASAASNTSSQKGTAQQRNISALRDEKRQKEQDLQLINEKISDLVAARDELVSEIAQLNDRMEITPPKQSLKHGKGIDFESKGWNWDARVVQLSRDYWHITRFRACQLGIINAALANRDVIAILPTGGGKSLTYQLPALLGSGTTVVITPLVSLMHDQVEGLRERNIRAELLYSASDKEEMTSVMWDLTHSTDEASRIKLLYVTPERVVANKKFSAKLQQMYDTNLLDRIVVDEAHCCSQMGHDFRPDYKKLTLLRTYFPQVPIMALTATCPPIVLQDILKILRLKTTTPGTHAESGKTVFFAASLFRPNLHYQVIPKTSVGNAVIGDIVDWIHKQHERESGIIYVLSQKETEAVSESIMRVSREKGYGYDLRAAPYHAMMHEADKMRVHDKWRRHEIQIVVATIAFGMGIDKPDVRFVVHHTMSKSIEGFYQESGRAGRDGLAADCVVFFRPQDVMRLTQLVSGDPTQCNKIYELARFCMDTQTCRKLAFAEYFSLSSETNFTNSSEPCGICDNCTRPKGQFTRKDVTLDTWRALRVLHAVQMKHGQVTVAQAADVIRGKGSFNVKTGRRAVEKDSVDVNDLVGGPLALTKDEAEKFLVFLLLEKYLVETFTSSGYGTNSYIHPAARASIFYDVSKHYMHDLPQNRVMMNVLSKKSMPQF